MLANDPSNRDKEVQMRIAARSAMSEKEDMEKDLKALRVRTVAYDSTIYTFCTSTRLVRPSSIPFVARAQSRILPKSCRGYLPPSHEHSTPESIELPEEI